ncbi:MAG: CAP domain-containing protein [Patescibacteria group bacterium]
MKKLFQYLFAPTEENSYRAKVLHNNALSLYLLFAVVLVLVFKVGPLSNILGYATDITVDKLYQLTNEQRVQNNLPLLIYNNQLSRAAEQKARDMFANNYWSHYSPSGSSPWDFISSQGYKYEVAGENLAKNFIFSNNVVDAWMASSSHRENLLRNDFSEVGFARVDGILDGQETTLIVQFFGKPAETKNSLTLPNETEEVVAAATAVGDNTKLSTPQNTITRSKKLIDFSKISFNLTVFLILFISVALISDLYIASKLKLIRIHGKNLAHLIFLITMLTGLYFFLSKGVIL